MAGERLAGYKGSQFLDSGYFFAPYIPLTSTPVLLPGEHPRYNGIRILDDQDADSYFSKPKKVNWKLEGF